MQVVVNSFVIQFQSLIFSHQTFFNIFKNKEKAFRKKKKRLLSEYYQITKNLRKKSHFKLSATFTKNKKKKKYPSRSTLIRLWYNISTISQLSIAQWTISNLFQQQYPKKNATRTQYTVSKMKGPPCRWYGQVYILAWKCPRVSVAARVPVYHARGYKACHVPAGVLPPGVRSSGPNQPASPNQLQRAAGPTTIEITLSLAASLPRDSRFSFSLKCHALEMGPLDCRPLDLLILPDHRTIRDRPIRWLRWLLVMMIHFFFLLSYFLFFFLSLSLSLLFFLFSAERIDCWLRSRLIGLDAKDRG